MVRGICLFIFPFKGEEPFSFIAVVHIIRDIQCHMLHIKYRR